MAGSSEAIIEVGEVARLEEALRGRLQDERERVNCSSGSGWARRRRRGRSSRVLWTAGESSAASQQRIGTTGGCFDTYVEWLSSLPFKIDESMLKFYMLHTDSFIFPLWILTLLQNVLPSISICPLYCGGDSFNLYMFGCSDSDAYSEIAY